MQNDQPEPILDSLSSLDSLDSVTDEEMQPLMDDPRFLAAV